MVKVLDCINFQAVWKYVRCVRPHQRIACTIKLKKEITWKQPRRLKAVFPIPNHDFRTGTGYPIHHNINPPGSRRVDPTVRRARNHDLIVSDDRVDEINETRVGVNAVGDETEVHQGD